MLDDSGARSGDGNGPVSSRFFIRGAGARVHSLYLRVNRHYRLGYSRTVDRPVDTERQPPAIARNDGYPGDLLRALVGYRYHQPFPVRTLL